MSGHMLEALTDQMRQAFDHSVEVCLGIDLVNVDDIDRSWTQFGAAFLERIYTLEEVQYALSALHRSDAVKILAARFAAREAAIKAFGLSEAGINWKNLEVSRGMDGHCELRISGRAAELIGPINHCKLSLTHEGSYAAAIVFAVRQKIESHDSPI
jgi:holo-[acyl-carrier protein] synthase